MLAPRMRRAFRKVVTLALLAWLPLQAAALPALGFLCEVDPGAVHGHAGTHSHHADHEHGGDGHGDEDSSPPGPHCCCHHFYSAALLSLSTAAVIRASGVDPTPFFHPDFFTPEQPQPPPLARLA